MGGLYLPEGRHAMLTLRPGEASCHRAEAVSEVDKHPRGDHETVNTDHSLDQQQGHAHPLQQGEYVKDQGL